MLKTIVLKHIPHDARRRLYAWQRPDYYSHLQAKRTGEKNGYSFVQFDRTRSIFIHIPKAAGISLCESLYGNHAAGHTRLDECEIAYSRKEFRTFFKFTFVRNPWDRLYSAYAFLKNGGMSCNGLISSGARLDYIADSGLDYLRIEMPLG